MNKYLLALCLLCAALTTSFSQSASEIKNSSRQTSFFAELGGGGILFSVNVDQRFKASRLGFGWRAGIGFTGGGGYIDNNGNDNLHRRSVLTVPAQLNYVFGKGSSPHTFEVGAGLTYLGEKAEVYTFDRDEDVRVFGSFSFMYRRQPENGGFSWRIGFTPLIAKGYIQPAAGLSIGYNF